MAKKKPIRIESLKERILDAKSAKIPEYASDETKKRFRESMDSNIKRMEDSLIVLEKRLALKPHDNSYQHTLQQVNFKKTIERWKPWNDY